MDNWHTVKELEAAIRRLDMRLQPVASRAIDIEAPDWGKTLESFDPMKEAGIRHDEAEDLLQTIIQHYADGSDDERHAIRDLFERYSAFAWGVRLPRTPVTEATLRQHLVLFSIQDQGKDGRDAVLALQDLCREAAKAGVDLGPIKREAAALSSARNKYGMGSTQDLLLGVR